MEFLGITIIVFACFFYVICFVQFTQELRRSRNESCGSGLHGTHYRSTRVTPMPVRIAELDPASEAGVESEVAARSQIAEMKASRKQVPNAVPVAAQRQIVYSVAKGKL